MPKRSDIKKVLVIGSGPIVIGQAAEFDYAGAQACRVLKDAGVNVVLCNSNPATIMTDKALADEIYLEPLTLESIKRIIKKERPDSLLPDEVIDLNAADAYDLDRLPGIGPAKAEAILTYREEHGPFQSVDDLLSVSGIGEVTLENLRPYVTAGSAAETAEATGG